jgi:tetratricopeptide (TPR) repeat protein
MSMPRLPLPPRLLLALPLLVLLAGCAANRLYRDGETLAQAGASYEAAIRYLDALDEAPQYAMAHEGLASVQRDAYTAKLAEARLAEARRDWASALTAYGELDVLLTRITTHGAVGFPTIDVAERMAATQNHAADDHYAAAEAAQIDGAWADAIAGWRSAQALVAGYRDTEARIGGAYFAWATMDEGAGRWRAATGHFVDAAKSGHADGNARAAAVYAALGNAFVWSGNCRQAVRDLRAARDLVAPVPAAAAAVKEDLDAAESCAVSTVVLLPFENATRQSPGGIALNEAAADGLAASLRAGASGFVKLLERTAVDQIKEEQDLSAKRTGVAGQLTRAHWLVIGKLTQVRVVAPATTATPSTIVGRTASTCPETRTDGTTTTVACLKDVPVRYVDHVGRGEVRLAGSVRVIDSRTGVQTALLPFNVQKSADVHWADGFVGPDGRPVILVADGAPPTVAVQVPPALLALEKASRTLPDEGQLVHAALDLLYAETTKGVLLVIDADPPASDPATLVVTAL